MFFIWKQKRFSNIFMNQICFFDLFYEGHPISILEAMSIGLPIVASKVTGNIDTVKDNYSGFFYKLGDINEACNCIERIMKNSELKLKISNNSFFTHRKLFTTYKMKNSY